MSDPYDRCSHSTIPIPREELAPVEQAPETRPALEEASELARVSEDEEVTMTRCPLCAGGGMVTAEILAWFTKETER